jgi:hypothetical protein
MSRLLVPDAEFLVPDDTGMTPVTQALFKLLFPSSGVSSERSVELGSEGVNSCSGPLSEFVFHP